MLKIVSLLVSLPPTNDMRFHHDSNRSRHTQNPISAIETGKMRTNIENFVVVISEISPVAHGRILVNEYIKEVPRAGVRNVPSGEL